MATLVTLRALNRGTKVRVKNSGGNIVQLSSTINTTVDLDDVAVRKALGHHSAIGQFIVTTAGATGATGATGPAGPTGPQGPQGEPGTPG